MPLDPMPRLEHLSRILTLQNRLLLIQLAGAEDPVRAVITALLEYVGCWEIDEIVGEILAKPNKAQASPEVIHTSCVLCGQDIEGIAPFPPGDWRDRGNNTHCPDESGRTHEPYAPNEGGNHGQR